MKFKFGDKIWDKRLNGWGLVVAAYDGWIKVRPFGAINGDDDYRYHDSGKDDLGQQYLFTDKPKEPRFAPGTPLVAKANDGSSGVYTFIAGDEPDSANGIRDAAQLGFFSYSEYDFFVVGKQYQYIN